MNYRRLVWPFSFYFLFLAGVSAHLPYLVLYYQSLAFTGAQIGLLAGIAPLITLVSIPLVTRLADQTNRHRLIMSLSMLAGLGCMRVSFGDRLVGSKQDLLGRNHLLEKR